MKCTPASIAVVALALAVGQLFAGSNETEFLQLRENRDKALADAAKPINEEYKAALEKLLERAIAEDDKDTAPIIQFELQSLSATGTAPVLPVVTETTSALQTQLAGTKWRLNPDKTFELHPDGTTTSNWTLRAGTWKVAGPNTVELSIWNVPRTETVSVAQGGTLITWLNKEDDQQYPQVAKKIVPEAAK